MPGGGRGGDGQRAPWAGASPQRSLQERFDALERLVLGLRGGGGTGSGEGQRRDGGKGGQGQGGGSSGGLGKGAARAAGNGGRGRPGDWSCSSCGAYPCFARATSCFRCSAPRVDGPGSPPPQQRGKGGGLLARDAAAPTYLGPIGANGTRPLLGRRGNGPQAAGLGRGQPPAADVSPTFRVPGSSMAARAEQERSERGLGNGQRQQPQLQGQEATTTAGATTAAAAPASAPPRPPVQTTNRWAALDEPGDGDEEEDGAVDMDFEGGDDEGKGDATTGEGRGEQPGVEDEPAPVDLRREWDRLCAAYRRLEKDGEDLPPSVLASVREQRDEAERRWRAAKPPQPLHKRLRWAEAELREAEAKELARQRELQEHLAATARRTAELEQRLAVDRARTERRRSVLQGLQGRESVSRCPATEAATRIALQGITEDIAPVLAAAMANLGEEATGTRQGIQQAVQALSNVQEVLREAAAAAAESRQPAGLLGEAIGTNVGGGSDGADAASLNATGAAQRWTREGPSGQWKKARTSESASSSVAAAAEARRMLQARAEESGLDTSGLAPVTADARNDAAYTNDLGEATRRAEQAAQRQLQEAVARQQAPKDLQQLQDEEVQRHQRVQQQQLEMQKHQAAVEQAAAARAAEEVRQREEMLARMSPEDLARAAEMHAQQLAVGAHAFGSQPASQVAGLVHQSIVHEAAQEAAQDGCGADENFLMSLSPEEFAQWDRSRQGGDNGACPW